ncbi:uncharacterized protein MELLADRAFT_69479 [Melampsora larici-populina 98AG31]|uniref:Uncharacterized protein n=1 Tax=Melampsora larici-populina (strain 98AG31 / pathotype 3-4-7) TaxID=747676 RepID=F4SAW5_MELLP|nr:uncharacterized protein MELLADRAFT_69479 [Melampsora larici-populina 98AG31]EGF98178.1 hypothetical protein MELLADRAFT_69479 [Melampsora larici-populina 98AG31]
MKMIGIRSQQPRGSTDDAENSEASDENNQVSTPASKKKQHQARPTQKKKKRGSKATERNVTVEKTPPPTPSEHVANETPHSATDGEKLSPEKGSTSWMVEKIYGFARLKNVFRTCTDQLQAHIARSDKKYEALVKEMKVMSNIMTKGIENRTVKKVETHKTRGGTTSVSIVFDASFW